MYVLGIMDAGENGSAPRPPEIDYGYDNARIGEIASKMFLKVAGTFVGVNVSRLFCMQKNMVRKMHIRLSAA